MHIFKLGRGDFFGILVPGAFLIINMVIFLGGALIELSAKLNLPSILNSDGLIYGILFILSYIFGICLRLISPNYMDRLSSLIWIFFSLFISFKEWIVSIMKKEKKKFYQLSRKKIRLYWQSFPYIEWFYDYLLPRMPYSYEKFYLNLLEKEFKNNREYMKRRFFFNFCKSYIIENSRELYDDMLYAAGLVRLICGMSYSLFFCIIIFIFASFPYYAILYLYLILFGVFIIKLRHTRVKEVLIIFEAFYLSVANANKISKSCVELE